MAVEVFWQDVPQLVGVAVYVLLAGVLLWVNFASRVNRAFALLLLVRAGLNVTYVFRTSPLRPPDTTTVMLYNLFPYFDIAATFAAIYFAVAYRERYAGARAPRALLAGLLAALLAVEGLYAWNHQLFFNGPLGVFNATKVVAYVAAAVVLARDAVRASASAPRRSTLLVAGGLALLPAFISMRFGVSAVVDAVNDTGWFFAGPGPLWFKVALVGALLADIALSAWAWLLLRRAAHTHAADARLALLAALLVAVAAATGVVVGIVDLVSHPLSEVFLFVLDGVWTLALGLLATYALVRHQLFDLDLKIRWTIRQSTVAAVFVGVFFVVSEAAQTFFQSTAGPYIGIAAAGTLVFAMAPLQRVAERVATAAVPHARAAADLDATERGALYRDQVAFAWSDGSIDRAERALLNRLRERLGISLEDAARIEHEVASA